MSTSRKLLTLRSVIQIATTLCWLPPRSSISKALPFNRLLVPSTTPSVDSRLQLPLAPRVHAKDHRSMSSTASTGNAKQPDDVRKQKQDLRKKLRAAMKELTVEDIDEQSKSVWTRVFELPVYRSAKTVGLFLSMPTSEINTDLILQHCVQNKKDIYVPEVGKNFELCDMELRKVILGDAESGDTIEGMFHKTWPKNKWKIPEPPADMPNITAQPGDIDLMIVPGLGFDRTRNRLGQGKGYYDRFLAKMTKDGQNLPLVAVALKPQLIEDTQIPVACYDKQMDMVVLPDEVITP